LIQVADLTGVYGVSWLIVLVNGWLAYLLLMRRLHWSLSLLVLCLVFVGVYGWKRFQVVDAMQQQTDLWVVGLAQGNIDQFRKWDPAYQQETLRRYQQLSVLAAGSNPRPALLVWPETAAPFFYDMENKLTPQLQEIVREMGIPLLFGSPGAALQEGVTRLYNKVYLIDTEGKTVGDYAKQHLVPFGEYVPLQKLLFFVHRLVEAAGDFAAGRDQLPIVLDGRRLGVLICYEAIFPELSRSAVRRGANVLVNVTNDAWFGTSSAPYQHLEMARWRAVENRVPLIRCANTGISTVFEPSGRSGQMLPLNETGYLTCAVHPVKMTTVYAVWGDWFAWLCVLTALCGLLYFPRGSKRGGILL
jgi:apolipoprotein N-acyltransferase